MAATIAVLGSTLTTTAGNKTVTATPTVGDLIVVITVSTGVTTTLADNGTGGTYTQVGSTQTGFSTSGNLQMFVRNNIIASASSTIYTATQTSSTGGGLVVLRVTGMTLTGAAAVRSSGGQSTVAAGTPAPVLSLTPLSSNPIITAMANSTSSSTTNVVQRTGYTEDFDNGYNTPPTGLEVSHLASGETSANLTYGGATGSQFASIAIELQFNSAPTTALNTPADTSTGQSVTPTLNFTGTDADSDTLEYEAQVALDNTFIANGLIGGWQFDENTGSSVGDITNTNTGTWNGTLGSQWTPGIINSGGSFNGANNYVLLKNGAILGGRTNCSISLWMKCSSSTAPITFDIYNERASTGNDLFRVEVSVTDKFYKFSIRDDAGNLKQLTDNVTILTDGLYHNLVITKSGQAVIMYNNGVSVVNTSISPVSDNFTNAGIQTAIGAYSAGATEYYPGIVDEVYVWNRALTPAEVTLIYNSGAGRQFANFLLDKLSTTDAGFTAGHPFASGVAKDFTVQAGDTLANSTTYYWRVRAIDPTGTNTYGAWATTRSFTTTAGVAAVPNKIYSSLQAVNRSNTY